MQKNPAHYHVAKALNQTWQERLDEMVMSSIDKLKKSELVTDGQDGSLEPTEFGGIMSKVSFSSHPNDLKG